MGASPSVCFANRINKKRQKSPTERKKKKAYAKEMGVRQTWAAAGEGPVLTTLFQGQGQLAVTFFLWNEGCIGKN